MTAYYFEITKALFTIYVVLLVAAGAFDAWKFIIPNWLSLVLALLFVAAGLASPFGVDWLSHLGAGAAVLVGGFLLYSFKRILGAGDVKLMTAVALWTGFAHLLDFLLVVAFFGGVLAIALIVGRQIAVALLVQSWWKGGRALPRILVSGEAVPYGIAVAAGGIFVAGSLPLLGNP
jgi:prepilin peptidase CpaA